MLKTQIVIAGVFTTILSSAQASENIVRIYNWADYMAPGTLKAFSAETGTKVQYDIFDSNETLEAKLLTGNSGYDIVVPSSQFLSKQIKAGVYQPLHRDKLSNWPHLDPRLMKRLETADPGNQYSVPYMWGTVGIGYNWDKVQKALGNSAPVNSWDLVFKPENLSKLHQCGVAFLDTPVKVMAQAMQYLGLDPNSKNVDDYKKATALLQTIRPYITYFSSSRYTTDLANGDICIVVGYSGDVVQARSRALEAGKKIDIRYSVPKEGANLWFDMIAIPKDVQNVDNAHQLINYLLKPEVIASISNFIGYANANKDATALMDPKVKNDPAVYPADSTIEKLFVSEDMPPNIQRVMTREWTRIRSGQ